MNTAISIVGLISFLIFFVCYVVYIWYTLSYNLLIVQQSSYFTERYTRWLRKHIRVADYLIMLGIFCLNITFVNKIPDYALFGVSALLCLLARLIVTHQKEKKPLVITWRIRRLIFIWLIVSLLVAAFVFSAVSDMYPNSSLFMYFPMALAAVGALRDPLMIIATMIAKPIEKNIQKGFIKEAQSKLNGIKDLKVIGITGSFGKTSTKVFLGTMLSEKYETLVTPESYNTPMGVVRTINESLKATHEVFICEMGARNVGDIKEICDIVHPTTGVITAIGEMHIETFKTLDNVIKTKYELCDEVLNNKGHIYLNCDNNLVVHEKNERKLSENVICFGTDESEKLDVKAINIKISQFGTEFDLVFNNREDKVEVIHVHSHLLGTHNVLNIVAAAAVAYDLGVSTTQIQRAVAKIKPVEHRLCLMPSNGKYQIIDDAYNSNPTGAKEALKVLGAMEGFRMVMTPGIVEAGEASAKINTNLGIDCANNADAIIIVGDNIGKHIRAGAKKQGFSEDKIVMCNKLSDAFSAASDFVEKYGNGQKSYLLIENDLSDCYL